MQLRKIFAFIFSVFLVSGTIMAQELEQKVKSILQPTPKPEIRAINFGVDLSRLAMPLLDSTRIGWEFSGDFELLKDMFVGAEFGFQNTNFTKNNYQYSGNGYYSRIGVDYNFMKHVDINSLDKMLIGIRYGFTTFNHQAKNISLTSPYYGSYTGGSIDKNWLGANWLEVVLGMRAELLANFYLGWSVRIRMKVWSGTDPNMQPYYIPGYGRDLNGSNIGLNYSLYYQIPLKKKSKTIAGE